MNSLEATTHSTGITLLDSLDENLINSLVGYENISVYNNILRSIPVKDICSGQIKKNIAEAKDTTDYWMK